MSGQLKLRGLILFLLCSVTLASLLNSMRFAWGDDAALSRIGAADDAVRGAFRAVLDAEQAGANVSGLLAELDVAGGFLTGAKVAYESGNVSEAAGQADLSIAKADSVVSEASSLKGSAGANRENSETLFPILSWVGCVLFVGLLLFAWVRFKRFYVQRLLRTRPEAVADAKA